MSISESWPLATIVHQ